MSGRSSVARSPLTVAAAREEVLAHARRRAAARPRGRVAVAAGAGRILAEEVRAAGDTPPFPCSAMDGYAVRAGHAGRTLAVVGESRAGHPAPRPIAGPAEAIRISTGAAIPAGADAVIRQEDTEPGPDGTPAIRTTVATPAGDNIRGAGEDQRAGDVVLAAGTRLGAAELGAAVGAGVGELTVAAAPRVAVLCTGDELRPPGAPLGPGEIHNSNAVALAALAAAEGAWTAATAVIGDDRGATEAALAEALAGAEVLVISGGVSVGPHDHVKPALAALGVEEVFWRVALRPGGPTWFGTRDGALVFGLPGNPVSAYVTFALFAAPALAALQGAAEPAARASYAVLDGPVPANAAREQAIRVRLTGSPDGRQIATPTGPQGSHVTRSLLTADALALVPAGPDPAPAGTVVPILPLPR